jgi:hypothetical protein
MHHKLVIFFISRDYMCEEATEYEGYQFKASKDQESPCGKEEFNRESLQVKAWASLDFL